MHGSRLDEIEALFRGASAAPERAERYPGCYRDAEGNGILEGAVFRRGEDEKFFLLGRQLGLELVQTLREAESEISAKDETIAELRKRVASLEGLASLRKAK